MAALKNSALAHPFVTIIFRTGDVIRLIGKGSSDAAPAHRSPNFLKSPPTKLIRECDINLPFNSPFEPFAYFLPELHDISGHS